MANNSGGSYTEGEVDIVTEVQPIDTPLIENSPFSHLEAVESNEVLAGIFNRFEEDSIFDDWSLREAFNLAIDLNKLINKGFLGYAHEVPSLTPPWAFDFPQNLTPKEHNPKRAKELLSKSKWPANRVLRLAAPSQWESAVRLIAEDFEATFGIPIQVCVIPPDEEINWIRI
jgi:peptide/nickel transport system substrate-binding protein